MPYLGSSNHRQYKYHGKLSLSWGGGRGGDGGLRKGKTLLTLSHGVDVLGASVMTLVLFKPPILIENQVLVVY